MEKASEYLERTRSAAVHLFNGIDSYMAILRDSKPAVLVGNYASAEAHEANLEKWATQNADQIEAAMAAQRSFVAEKYALATLCGSVLQIASMAIRLYSTNTAVNQDFADVVKGNKVAYCVGRLVRGVPLGLVIYAARNQYNHVDDGHLREPSATVFDRLATNHGYGTNLRDPAFDLALGLVWNYPSNVTNLVGWRSYAAYECDMKSLLQV